MGSLASSAPARALRRQSGWHAPLSAAVLYVATSIAMNITHAAITERVSLPLTVSGIEMLFACAVLLLIFPRTLHYGNWSDVLTWGSTMPLLFAFGIGFNMLALRHTGVSHTLMIRYVFPFVTLLVESIFTERLPIDVASLLSIMLSAVGVTLFMFTGEGISGEGVLYIILNSLSVISEQLIQRWLVAVRPVDISFSGLMLLNNGIGALIIGLMLLAFGEHERWGNMSSWPMVNWWLIAAGCILGTAIGWTALHCVQYVSATMMLQLSNLDKALVIFGSISFFGAQRSSDDANGAILLREYIGVSLAVFGGLLYVLARTRLTEVERVRQENMKAGNPAGDEIERRGILFRLVSAVIFARLDTWYFLEEKGEKTRLLPNVKRTEAYISPLNRIFGSRGKKLSKVTVVTLSCAFCMFCSIGMSLCNKWVVREFNLSVTITCLQMLSNVVVLVIFFRWYKFGTWKDVCRWGLVSFVWGFNLATSNFALRNASLGLVMVTRNCSPIISFILEATFQEVMPMSAPAIMGLLLMSSGVVLYTYNDVSLTTIGLLSCFADIFLGILAAMLQRRYIAVYPVAISFGGMLLLQNFIGLFPDAVFALGIGEHHEWGSLFGRSVSAYLMFALSCILGLVMGWASINAQQYVTATTMMVMGNVNRILIIVGGTIVVGEEYTWLGVLGIILAIAGSIWYGYTRTQAQYGRIRFQWLTEQFSTDDLAKLERDAGSRSRLKTDDKAVSRLEGGEG